MEDIHIARHGVVEGAEMPRPSWAYPSFINRMNSLMYSLTQKLSKSHCLGCFWRFYYIDTINVIIDHWWLTSTSSPLPSTEMGWKFHFWTFSGAESSNPPTMAGLSSNHPLCCSVVSHVWLFVSPWTAAFQASLSFSISQSLLKLMAIESVMPSNHLVSWSYPGLHIFSQTP